LLAITLAIGFAVGVAAAHEGMDPLAAWYRSLTTVDGKSCCSMRDCGPVEARLKESRWEVLIQPYEGGARWVEVPDRAVCGARTPMAGRLSVGRRTDLFVASCRRRTSEDVALRSSLFVSGLRVGRSGIGALPPPAARLKPSWVLREPMLGGFGTLTSDRGFSRSYDISHHSVKLPRVSAALGRLYLRCGADLPQVGWLHTTPPGRELSMFARHERRARASEKWTARGVTR